MAKVVGTIQADLYLCMFATGQPMSHAKIQVRENPLFVCVCMCVFVCVCVCVWVSVCL